jgi:hypothetical protein
MFGPCWRTLAHVRTVLADLGNCVARAVELSKLDMAGRHMHPRPGELRQHREKLLVTAERLFESPGQKVRVAFEQAGDMVARA